MPGDIHVAVDGVVHPQPDPLIHRPLDPWSGSRSGGTRPAYAGWGGAQVDATPYGVDLQIAGRTYTTGFGVLAGSRLEVRNRAGFAHFHALVGVYDSTAGRRRGVRFEVYGDGRRLAATAMRRFGEAAVAVEADVRGVAVIELVARAADSRCDAAGRQPAAGGLKPLATR